jgi:hypothetical protein
MSDNDNEEHSSINLISDTSDDDRTMHLDQSDVHSIDSRLSQFMSTIPLTYLQQQYEPELEEDVFEKYIVDVDGSDPFNQVLESSIMTQ